MNEMTNVTFLTFDVHEFRLTVNIYRLYRVNIAIGVPYLIILQLLHRDDT